MRPIIVLSFILIVAGLSASLALANPAMLPKHPGYPAGKDTSPVTGQPLANDPGQLSLSVEQSMLQGAAAEDSHVVQRLNESQDERIIERRGAGQLPKVEGPNILIDPPVKEATRMPQPAEPK